LSDIEVAQYNNEVAEYASNAGFPHKALAYNGLSLITAQPGDLLTALLPPCSVGMRYACCNGSSRSSGEPIIMTRYGGSGILSFCPKHFHLSCIFTAPKGRSVPISCIMRATPEAALSAPALTSTAAGPFHFTFAPPPGTPPATPVAMQQEVFPLGVIVTGLVFSLPAVPMQPGDKAYVDFCLDYCAYDVVMEF
jgi:hypothetical protein